MLCAVSLPRPRRDLYLCGGVIFMKSIADLEKIRQLTLKANNLGRDSEGVRVVVGMATCGIAAGATPVMEAMTEEVGKRNLPGVVVVQTGCIGMCRYEPIVEVTLPGKDKVTYVHVKADMVKRIVDEHVVGGNPVVEYTIGAVEE